MKGIRYSITILCALFLLSASPAMSDESGLLKAGKWKGFYNMTGEDKFYQIQFIVNYRGSEESKDLKIEMINLDNGLRYQLTDIKIEGSQLQYKIPGNSDTKTCNLEKNDDKYEGECLSDQAKEGETSQISMRIPAE